MIELFKFTEPFELPLQNLLIDQTLDAITIKQKIEPTILQPGKYDLTPENLQGRDRFFLRVRPSGDGIFIFRSLKVVTISHAYAGKEGIQQTNLTNQQSYRLPKDTSHILIAETSLKPNVQIVYSAIQHRQ